MAGASQAEPSEVSGIIDSREWMAPRRRSSKVELGGLARNPQAIEDGLRSGSAVTNEDQALDTEQGRRAVLGGVEHGPHPPEGRASQEAAQRGHGRGRDLLPDHVHQETGHCFAGFEEDVAGKSIGDDNVGFAPIELFWLDIADVVQPGALKQMAGVFDQLVPLPRLLPVREQGDAWGADAQAGLGVHRTENRELGQVLGFAIGVGADVEEQGVTRPDGKLPGESGALDPANASQPEQCIGHCAAGVAAGHEHVGAPGLDQIEPHRHRRHRLPPGRVRRLVGHLKHLGSVDYDQLVRAQTNPAKSTGEQDLGPDQQDRVAPSMVRLRGGGEFGIRMSVGTHCVKGDTEISHGCSTEKAVWLTQRSGQL